MSQSTREKNPSIQYSKVEWLDTFSMFYTRIGTHQDFVFLNMEMKEQISPEMEFEPTFSAL